MAGAIWKPEEVHLLSFLTGADLKKFACEQRGQCLNARIMVRYYQIVSSCF